MLTNISDLDDFIKKSVERCWGKTIKAKFSTPISIKVLMEEEQLKPYRDYEAEDGRLFGLSHNVKYIAKGVVDYGKGHIDILLEKDDVGQEDILYALRFFVK